MESITQGTKQIIIQSGEAVTLRREIERVFMRIEGDSSFSLAAMESQLPKMVELYNILRINQ